MTINTFKSTLLFLGIIACNQAYAECAKDSQQCRNNIITSHADIGLDKYTSWSWFSGYQLSGLHWNQFISLSMNFGIEEYKYNYAKYLRSLSDEDDDDKEDESETEDANASKNAYKSYPIGTTIVKENYLSDQGKPGDLSSITVMRKRETGFDEAGGNWEYMQFGANGQLFFRGGSQQTVVKHSCHSCHLNVSGRDFVFATVLSSNVK